MVNAEDLIFMVLRHRANLHMAPLHRVATSCVHGLLRVELEFLHGDERCGAAKSWPKERMTFDNLDRLVRQWLLGVRANPTATEPPSQPLMGRGGQG